MHVSAPECIIFICKSHKLSTRGTAYLVSTLLPLDRSSISQNMVSVSTGSAHPEM